MLALMDQTREPFVADEAEAVVARTAADRLRAVAEARQDVKITVDTREDEKIIVPLPAAAVGFIHGILEAMANRTPVSVIPHDAELSTQQAADFLNVSRPYLVKKLEAGEIAFRKVGKHRRVKFADLLDYEHKSRQKRADALAALHEEEAALGLE